MKAELRRPLLGITLYGALWAATGILGNAPMESFLDGLSGSTPLVSSHAALRESVLPAHYRSAMALAPFLLHADFGYTCGPLCGKGGSFLAVWLPTGVIHPFWQTGGWVS